MYLSNDRNDMKVNIRRHSYMWLEKIKELGRKAMYTKQA